MLINYKQVRCRQNVTLGTEFNGIVLRRHEEFRPDGRSFKVDVVIDSIMGRERWLETQEFLVYSCASFSALSRSAFFFSLLSLPAIARRFASKSSSS